jgi:hypothetical protein
MSVSPFEKVQQRMESLAKPAILLEPGLAKGGNLQW